MPAAKMDGLAWLALQSVSRIQAEILGLALGIVLELALYECLGVQPEVHIRHTM